MFNNFLKLELLIDDVLPKKKDGFLTNIKIIKKKGLSSL